MFIYKFLKTVEQSCQPFRKNCICYNSRKGIRKYESASKKYEFTKPKKKKKKKKDWGIAKSQLYTQCSACNTRGRTIMEWIRTSATYTSAELKSARTREPPQWVTPSGTSWISSPGCRQWVDGETVEVLHVHCFLSRSNEQKSDRWTDDLFQASLNGERDFILMDISSTFWLCIWHIEILELIFSDTRAFFIFWLLKM